MLIEYQKLPCHKRTGPVKYSKKKRGTDNYYLRVLEHQNRNIKLWSTSADLHIKKTDYVRKDKSADTENFK